MNGNGGRRTFSELRKLLLLTLSQGQQTTNQLSIKTGINWRTVEAHLTFLIGKGLVTEVLKSEYVRIFKLTASLQYKHKQKEADETAETETATETKREKVIKI